MTRLKKFALVAVVNLAVFVVVLVGIEFGFRIYYGESDAVRIKAIKLGFAPYLMTTVSAKIHLRSWQDVFRNKDVAADVVTNNHGFPDPDDFDIAAPRTKKPGEKVIVLLGGSTAFGVGATANDKITHAQLAQILNGAQSDIHYVAINLAAGGWIAQQEAIALDLWGRLFDPDWVIALDGANDSLVGCAMEQGTGNPVYFQAINALVSGYLGNPSSATFYRGYWENQLIRFSVLYRHLTGKSYIAPPQHLEKGFDALQQVTEPTPLSEAPRQLKFYLLAEESILRRFPRAKYILSTQPDAEDFEFLLGSFYRDGEGYVADKPTRVAYAAYLDNWFASVNPSENQCGGEFANGMAKRYIIGMSAIRLAELAESNQADGNGDVEYYNTGLLYPKELSKRSDYFIDNYHLNDVGQEYLARFYAYRILRRDFPQRNWSALRPQALWFQ